MGVMRNRIKYYIYTSAEMRIFLCIALLECMIAFTLGVHYTKEFNRIERYEHAHAAHVGVIGSEEDLLPSEQDLFDQRKNFQEDLDKILTAELVDQVDALHLRLNEVKQLDLPEDTLDSKQKHKHQEK
jgi:hypothetical protein